MPSLAGGPPPTLPQPIMPQGSNGIPPPQPEILQKQLQIIQALQAQNVPQDQWAGILTALMAAQGGAPLAPPPVQVQSPYNTARDDGPRDRNGGFDHGFRSPPGRHNSRRSRSRSPDNGFRRRGSPEYDGYGDRNGRGDRRGGGSGRAGRAGGRDFRQRSPDNKRRSSSPQRQDHTLPPPGPKWMEFDRSIGEGNIKGLFHNSPFLWINLLTLRSLQ
jgi:protein NRD1